MATRTQFMTEKALPALGTADFPFNDAPDDATELYVTVYSGRLYYTLNGETNMPAVGSAGHIMEARTEPYCIVTTGGNMQKIKAIADPAAGGLTGWVSYLR